ncbi:hypothetical protein B0H17DRAFT_1128271 [Mycena rosella]|uniref:ATP-dependent DNA helicase n=1 Tax=Mycena rosella TaxID=1033263 RepID=A0AAD7GQI8_MYCRO|nr:hypothetical protein B0H17DRAFT_1128271 [Mycena rosella]
MPQIVFPTNKTLSHEPAIGLKRPFPVALPDPPSKRCKTQATEDLNPSRRVGPDPEIPPSVIPGLYCYTENKGLPPSVSSAQSLRLPNCLCSQAQGLRFSCKVTDHATAPSNFYQGVEASIVIKLNSSTSNLQSKDALRRLFEHFSRSSPSYASLNVPTVSGNSENSAEGSARAETAAAGFPGETEMWEMVGDDPMDGVEDAVSAAAGVEEYADFLKRFRIVGFRKDQHKIITETMAGRNTLVVMPTGGGKSLCYHGQLPAVLQNAKTNSGDVTVVLCPTVTALVDIGIDAVSLPREPHPEIEDRLRSNLKPYITPEKLQKNGDLQALLRSLYRAGNLARLVVDEAHCISTWGPKFRDAYLELHTFRDNFPGVPIMALTATATPDITRTIITQMKLINPKIFRHSINRPNLQYIVRQKHNDSEAAKAITEDIVDFVKEGGINQTGIIYRTTKTKCEKLAAALRKRGLSAMYYHGGMEDADKDSTQNAWKTGECRIMVATSAFGMGINKPNATLKRPDGLSGMANRLYACYVNYSFSDVKHVLDLAPCRDKPSSPEYIAYQKNVDQIVAYCENQDTCRRFLLLQHFAERFEKKYCNLGCDNCVNQGHFGSHDVSKEAKSAVTLVQSLQPGNLPLGLVLQVFHGANRSNIREHGHKHNPGHATGGALSHELSSLLFNRLLYLQVLSEEKVFNKHGYHYYLRLGPQGNPFLSKVQIVNVTLRVRPTKSAQRMGKTRSPKSRAKGGSNPQPVPSPEPSKDLSDRQGDAERRDLKGALLAHREEIAEISGFTPDEVLDDDVIHELVYNPPRGMPISLDRRTRDGLEGIDEATVAGVFSALDEGFLTLCQAWHLKCEIPTKSQPVKIELKFDDLQKVEYNKGTHIYFTPPDFLGSLHFTVERAMEKSSQGEDLRPESTMQPIEIRDHASAMFDLGIAPLVI